MSDRSKYAPHRAPSNRAEKSANIRIDTRTGIRTGVRASDHVNARIGGGNHGRSSTKSAKKSTDASEIGRAVRLWGRHAVQAALANPKRVIRHIWGTHAALESLDLPPSVPLSYCTAMELNNLLSRSEDGRSGVGGAMVASRDLSDQDEPLDKDGAVWHPTDVRSSVRRANPSNRGAPKHMTTDHRDPDHPVSKQRRPTEQQRHSAYQAIIIEVAPLAQPALEEILCGTSLAGTARPLVILDQVTDPRNIGAILRSAAAFNAAAVITQTRHSPHESGVLAKAASGALERVPWLRVVNIARTLDKIAEAGWWRIGLDAQAETLLDTILANESLDKESCAAQNNPPADTPIALILGAEGSGLRRNVRRHCDQMARLPMAHAIESLNISNAAAIALYAVAIARADSRTS